MRFTDRIFGSVFLCGLPTPNFQFVRVPFAVANPPNTDGLIHERKSGHNPESKVTLRIEISTHTDDDQNLFLDRKDRVYIQQEGFVRAVVFYLC